jgi:hypothetical protein
VCQHERETVKRWKDDIDKWASETRAIPQLKGLLDENRTIAREIAIHNFHAAKCRSRLVYRGDIENFCRAVKMINRIIKRDGVDHRALKDRLEKIAFPQFHSVVYEFERESVGKLLSSLRSLICRAHKKVISAAVFGRDSIGIHQDLSEFIVVLSEEEYYAYVTSLTELLGILNGDPTYEAFDGDIEGTSKIVGSVLNDLKTYHPILQTIEENADDSIPATVLSSPEGDFKKYNLSPYGMCCCETCRKEFDPVLERQKSKVDANIENVSIDNDSDERASTATTRSAIGAQATNPIVVESEGEESPNSLEFRAFELKLGSTIDEARANLREAAGQITGVEETMAGFALRRSSRKRKISFPVGCITKETKLTVGMNYNIAAIRLLLFERCEVPLSCRLLAGYIPDDTSIMPCVIDLKPTSNEDNLGDFLMELRKKDHMANASDCDLSQKLFFLHQKRDDVTQVDEESLLDSLLEISNTQSPNVSGKANNLKGKRKQASERGFRGTLLQSSSSVRKDDGNYQSKKSRHVQCYEESWKKAPVSDEESTMEPDARGTEEKLSTNNSSDEESILHPNDEESRQRSLTGAGSDRSPSNVLQIESDDEELVPNHRFTAIFEAMRKIERFGECIDELALEDAVRWALDKFPTESNAEIQSTAYCRYLEAQDVAVTLGIRNGQNLTSTEDKHVYDSYDRIERLTDNLKPVFGDCKRHSEIRTAVVNAVEQLPNASAGRQKQAAIEMLLLENGK